MNKVIIRPAKPFYNGFTLVEIAVVLVISSLLLASGTALLKTWMDKDNLSTNQQRLSSIQQAINNFKTINNRLPCPASFTALAGTTKYGRESTSCTGALAGGTYKQPGRTGTITSSSSPPHPTGTVIIGALPVRDLGLPDSYLANTRRYMYTYAITSSEATALNGFEGAIDVMDNSIPPKSVLPLAADSTSGTATYVVVDHGGDGKGAYPLGSATRNACTAGTGLDVYNCDYNTAPVSQFRNAPFSKQVGANWFDDMIVYDTSFSANTRTCTTQYQSSATAGTSTGHIQAGWDVGGGMTEGFVVYYIFQFWDAFYYYDIPTPGNNSASPIADAYCPSINYSVVAGGCSQTMGPATVVGSHVTNIYTGDIVTSVTLNLIPFGLANAEQLVLPPLSHPIVKSTGIQGWECNGNSGKGLYTQAYALCCTGGQ